MLVKLLNNGSVLFYYTHCYYSRIALHFPYSGKSSLLNMLAKRPAAIVSPVAGTTRDVVEVRMDFDGVSCIFSDTAGMRLNKQSISNMSSVNDTTTRDLFRSSDAIEIEGMRRARDVYMASHVKILICDASDKASIENALALLDTLETLQEPLEQRPTNDANIHNPDNLSKFVHKQAEDKSDNMVNQTFVIFNKTDLLDDEENSKESIRHLSEGMNLPRSTVGYLSCTTGEGLQSLESSLSSVIKTLTDSGDSNNTREGELITRARHRTHILACVEHLELFLEGNLMMDTAAEELRQVETVLV